jgi:CheY-like chemotaxis protein
MKVLVLEDEPVMRSFLRRVIGMSVTLEATSATEALDLCRNNKDIDLLICDVKLGLISGMELASLTRAWIPRLGTILLCDVPCELWNEQENAQLKELPSNAVMILEKPFRAVELKAAIKELSGIATDTPFTPVALTA